MRWLGGAAALVALNVAVIAWFGLRDRDSNMSPPSARSVAIAQAMRLREADFLTFDCSRCDVAALRRVANRRWLVALSTDDHRQCFSVPADPAEHHGTAVVESAPRRAACTTPAR